MKKSSMMKKQKELLIFNQGIFALTKLPLLCQGSKIKVKNAAIDFTIPIGNADLCFLFLQPGSAMRGWGPTILCFRTPFLFILQRFLQVPI